MIKKTYGIPAHGMQYELMTVEQKKAILKARVKRIFSILFSSCTFWMIFGYVIGSMHTLYIFVNVLREISKICGV